MQIAESRRPRPSAHNTGHVLPPRLVQLGVRTWDDVAEHVAAAHEDAHYGASGVNREYPPGPDGLEYVCADCGATLASRSGRQKHATTQRHTVLRADWLRADYWSYVLGQRAAA